MSIKIFGEDRKPQFVWVCFDWKAKTVIGVFASKKLAKRWALRNPSSSYLIGMYEVQEEEE